MTNLPTINIGLLGYAFMGKSRAELVPPNGIRPGTLFRRSTACSLTRRQRIRGASR